MPSRIFLDTNILIDFFDKREDYYDYAKNILTDVYNKKYEAYISILSLTNLYYILRKKYTHEQRIKIVGDIQEICNVLDINEITLEKSKKEKVKDLEDAIQIVTARIINADYIVTRDIEGFKDCGIKSVTSKEFIDLIK